MEVLKTLRHELKFVMPLGETMNLRNRLDKILTLDQGHEYMVRSLYFDSVNEDDYYAKQNGDMNRKKIRLRIYGKDDQKAKLELKAKYDVHQLKESLIISREDAEKLINEDYSCLEEMNNELASKMYRIMMEGNYKPKVIIEYNRIAYISSLNTRLTFDFDIKESHDFDKLFTDDINYIDCVDKKDIVLEVKYDRFLEPYIAEIINGSVSRYQSVSKYIMGRNI